MGSHLLPFALKHRLRNHVLTVGASKSSRLIFYEHTRQVLKIAADAVVAPVKQGSNFADGEDGLKAFDYGGRVKTVDWYHLLHLLGPLG